MQSRYSRQEIFPPIHHDGQRRISESSAVIVGCGALGSLLSEMMCRAGIGSLTIVDRDFVEYSNLHRQSMFTEEDAALSLPKSIAAANHLSRINSDCRVRPVVADLTPLTIDLLGGHSIILDGTDNFHTRYILNDAAFQSRIPWIYGACVASNGIAAAFVPPASACLRCLFETEPAPGSAATCDTAGIIWPAAGTVVSYQVAAALKILTGNPSPPELFQFDIWNTYYRVISLANAKRADCATCALGEFPSLRPEASAETTLCGRDAVQIQPAHPATINLSSIAERWRPLGEVVSNRFLAKLKFDEFEIVLFPDARAIIKGTTDPERARTLYARYVGA